MQKTTQETISSEKLSQGSEQESEVHRPVHRGIYLLPNLLTTAAMMAGFYAIVAAINGHYISASLAVFVAGLLDGLDGRIARLTNTQSAFGVQYDSLSDLVSFGLAPALVMYTWSLSTLKTFGPFWGKVGWATAFLYAVCAALRLARFNTQVGVADKRYFQGLASPAAAGLMMSYVWVVNYYARGAGSSMAFLSVLITISAALLMVSRVRYWSFKSWPDNARVSFLFMLLAMGTIVAIVVHPPLMLLGIASVYVVSGPIMTVMGMRRRRYGRDQD